MFGHLKAEEFVNVMEGVAIASERRRHLDHCAHCSAVWKSMESARADFAAIADDVPEPNWDEFRSSVRSELLSRSVQRTSTFRRWTGWPIRPAMAWGMSILMVIGVMTGGFLWHHERSHPAETTTGLTDISATVTPAAETGTIEAEMSVWSQAGVFEELLQLETVEEEYLREMLESAQQEVSAR
jgi:hypothetical protein